MSCQLIMCNNKGWYWFNPYTTPEVVNAIWWELEKAARLPMAYLEKALWLLHINEIRMPNCEFTLVSYINCIILRETKFSFILFIDDMQLPVGFYLLGCF